MSNINITEFAIIGKGDYMGEIYDISRMTPEAFDRIAPYGFCYLTLGGDLKKMWVISFNDKGCDEGGVYYKGACWKMGSDGCGHFEALWFNRHTFQKVVGDFMRAGGDLTTPAYRARLVWPSFSFVA